MNLLQSANSPLSLFMSKAIQSLICLFAACQVSTCFNQPRSEILLAMRTLAGACYIRSLFLGKCCVRASLG